MVFRLYHIDVSTLRHGHEDFQRRQQREVVVVQCDVLQRGGQRVWRFGQTEQSLGTRRGCA